MTPLYLSHAIEAVWPALANHVWQSTISVAVVALLTSLLRRYPARVSYSLWVIASAKFLVPFSLLVMIGGALPHPRYVSSQTAIYSAIDSAGRPFSAIPVAQAPSASRSAARRAPISDWLPAAFATMWLSGVVVVLLVWMARWRSISLVLRSATCADSGREATLLRELQSLAGAHKIDLLISDQLMEPGVFGILRPVIVWPAGLSERLDDQQLKAILAHELIHRSRLDNLTAALHMAVEAIFWFHPVVWWMERRLIEHREQACDEAVVRICNQPGSYAEGLLKACRFCIELLLAGF